MCDAIDREEKLIKAVQTILDLRTEKGKLTEVYHKILKDCYSLLCRYLDIELEEGEDPVAKLQGEIGHYEENSANSKAEIARLDKEKEDLKEKIMIQKEKLKQVEKMSMNPEGAIDAQSKLNFKEFSRRMEATYKTGDDGKAVTVQFKVGDASRGFKIDDPIKTEEQKKTDFWKLFDFIDVKNSANLSKQMSN